MEIKVKDPGSLIRYRFGLKTADFLICAKCGIYVAALLVAPDSCFATVNVNTLDFLEPLSPARTVSYEGESPEERIARRRNNWTPAVVSAAIAAGAR